MPWEWAVGRSPLPRGGMCLNTFIGRRLLAMLPVLLTVSFLVFSLSLLIPGDPAVAMLGRDATKEQVQALRLELGLDRPLLIQYGIWLQRAAHGDLGRSLLNGRPVAEQVLSRFPITLSIAVSSLVLALLMAIPFGMVAAVRRGTFWDVGVMFMSLVGISVPGFWMGMLLLMLFSVRLGWFPVSGFISIWQDPIQGLRFLALPSVSLGLILGGVFARMTRSSLLDVLGQDYVRTARAKGLAERRVLFGHALRGALLPVVTVVSVEFGWLLSGTVVIESVFAIPGMGRLMIYSIENRDYPTLQGAVLYASLTYLCMNLLADLLYSLMDPRIRYS